MDSEILLQTEFPYLDPTLIDSNFSKESYREGQKECLKFIVDAFNAGKKYVIIEVPTGGGKSAIGMTIANMVKSSYYLTITKILQDQLTSDFDDIVELKGRNAYPCTLYERCGEKLVDRKILSPKELTEKLKSKIDCNNGFCKSSLNRSDVKGKKANCGQCFKISGPHIPGIKIPKGDLVQLTVGKYSDCPYYEQVYTAVESKKVVMNFSSFLYQTSLTNRFMNLRDLTIIDEAHNIEPQLLEFVSFTLDDYILQNHGTTIPKYDTATQYAKWFKEINLEELLKQLISHADLQERHKDSDELEKTLNKYNMFMLNLSRAGAEWVVEYSKNYTKNSTHRTLTLKPVFATDFAQNLLFKNSKRILMMSATILDVDVMCRSLGISRSEVAAYRMKNRFPVKNRPIYIKPAAKMTGGKDKMAIWMPKMIKAVDDICFKYPDKKGIIHTHNFAIMNALLEKCKPAISKRFITQKEYPDKAHLLKAHQQADNSIIVAPAMHEGLNLIDDLSRFQIICKVPYANFYENKQLARRVEVDQKYYTWLTALKLVQSYGRSIRSETDFADTYIIDEAILRFINDAKNMLPSWFMEALVYK